ncbi:hypothetical protein BC628DRAFT_1316777 [Trametes gibbosa]|nr:hypothetical protein BC628DRAFT_1327480 [Trametes gibbosa]KAI0828197.1 hypothetical protein BC628DRAFT_1316777 [Trametes gibbosa]
MPPHCLEDADAIEAVTWDIAVACLALSIKFHRDVLYPLDVIYAHEYLDLAPHALAFDDLENAQRDVLEAVAFRVGSATPGAFMSELWTALPTLRLLLAFDDAWAGAQERTWVLLCDILQRTDALRYPISLLTASALSESIIRVLARKFNTTGCDGRARKLKKRDEQTLRKAAAKASRGVRLDIQEILSITNVRLNALCAPWTLTNVCSRRMS